MPHLFTGISKPSSVTLFLFLLLLLGACTKEVNQTDEDPFNPAVAKTLKDEPYGNGARQVADVYLPANRGANTRVVLMLHGGSWAEGNKTDLNDIVNLIRTQWPEVAIVNMNYTLATNTTETYHPAQMADISLALAHIVNKKDLWKISDRIAIAGVSAGGHLSLLYSYVYNSGVVRSVVSVVGPTDFSDPFYTSNPLFQLVVSNYLGASWQTNPDLHRAASPALRVTTTSPPTFMAYGRLDPLVPLSNATTLRNRLQTNGVAHTYQEYPTEGHEFTPAAINDLVPKVIQFLKTQL